jgi:thioredoxin-related protein
MIFIFLLQLFFAANPATFYTDYEEVFAHAKSEDHHVLMVFAGSDWCRPCIQFKESILLQEEFQAYSVKAVDVLYLDFPAKNKNKLSKEQTDHNEALAEKYNQSGLFPHIILMDKNENIIKEISYEGQDVDAFIKMLH